MQNEKTLALRLQVENHPLLQYPKEQRQAQTEQRQNLIQLVLRLKGFEAELEARLAKEEDSALVEDEAEIDAARKTSIGKNAMRLDTLAFMESFNKALAGFEPNRGAQFMTYFNRIYAYEIYHSANKTNSDASLAPREGKMWKQLKRLCEQMGLDAEELPQRYYEELGRCLGVRAEQIEELVLKATRTRRTFSIDRINTDDDDENDKTVEFADPNWDASQTRLENMAEVLRAVTMFADLDCQEYPRLFFTGDVLRPMREENCTVDPQTYCAVLERMEPLLWRQIFIKEYIEFLFAPPPALDSMRHLMAARLVRPLQDSSVAEYKHVSAAAVSYQRRRYDEMRRRLAAQM